MVLDLRGNGGGSSHWSQLMAQVLWGDAWMAAHPEPAIEAVEWRASDANIAQIAGYLEQLRASNGAPEYIAWAESAVNGMKAALLEAYRAEPKELTRRMRAMRKQIAQHDVKAWADSFMTQLEDEGTPAHTKRLRPALRS